MPEGLYDISMERLYTLGTDDSVQSCLEILQNFSPPHFQMASFYKPVKLN